MYEKHITVLVYWLISWKLVDHVKEKENPERRDSVNSKTYKVKINNYKIDNLL